MVVAAIHWTGRALFQLSTRGLPRGASITRFTMYERLAAALPVPLAGGRVLSIGHSVRLCGVLGLGGMETVEANYPDHDFLHLDFPEGSFDYVVSESVLEHVEGDPRQAIDESCRVLKPGGIAVHTACFVQPVHHGPRDLWRFSPDALRLLCGRFSEVIECGAWGSFPAIVYLWFGLQKEGIPLARWHPVHRLARMNSPLWPISTWIAVRK